MSVTWPMVRLGDVLTERQETPLLEEMVSGRIKIVSKISFDTGQIYIRPNGETRTGMILIRPGDLVVSGINAAKGAIAIYGLDNTEPVAATIHYGAYIPDSSRVNVDFLWWMLRSRFFRGLLDEYLPGGIKTELKATRLLPIPIPLPALDEQRRILRLIEELSVRIKEACRLNQEARAEADILLGARVSELFKNGPAKGWVDGKLGDYVSDDCYGTSEKTSDDEAGTPVLRMGNIQKGRIDLQNLRYLHLSERDKAKLLLQSGDILVNRTNSAELVGKCAVFNLEGDYSFASYLIRLRLDWHRADPWLVAAYINSPLGRKYMLSEKRQMTGQANVNCTKLKALPIALPTLAEQQRIVVELGDLQSKVDILKRPQIETAAELDALMSSILDRAFKGEL